MLCYDRLIHRDESVEPDQRFIGDIHRPHSPDVNSALRELRRCPLVARFRLFGRLDIRARRSAFHHRGGWGRSLARHHPQLYKKNKHLTLTLYTYGRRRRLFLGFANFLLFLGTRRFIPDVDTVPDFSTPRTRLDKTSSRILGISPFVLTPKPRDLDVEAKPRMVPVLVAAGAICASPDEEAFVSYPDEAKEADTGAETLNPRA